MYLFLLGILMLCPETARVIYRPKTVSGCDPDRLSSPSPWCRPLLCGFEDFAYSLCHVLMDLTFWGDDVCMKKEKCLYSRAVVFKAATSAVDSPLPPVLLSPYAPVDSFVSGPN